MAQTVRRMPIDDEPSSVRLLLILGVAIGSHLVALAARCRFKYPEFADSVDVPPDHTLVFKVRLKDRPIRPGSSEAGGALGRWLLHCHILPHAALGMISELVVLPAE